MFVRINENLYHVAFELERRPESRAITHCKIFLLTDASGPTLVGRGQTLLGKKDVFNFVTGCKFALRRALVDSCLQKPARTLFWKEFNRCHRRTCREAFGNVGGTFTVPRCVELYSFQRRAEKMMSMSSPSGRGTASMYAHLRHEYHDDPHDGGTVENQVFIRKLHGLGWRSRAEKNEQPGEAIFPENDYSKLEHRVLRQAESRCHRVRQQKITIINSMTPAAILQTLKTNSDRVKELIKTDKIKKVFTNDESVKGWAVSDDRLTARMQSLSLNAAKQAEAIDVKLLRRPGITKVHDEYIVDPDKFVPAFKAGDVVTYIGAKARVYRVDGPLVTITCGERVQDVFDHELETRPHWLRRVWRAVAKKI